MTDIAVVLPVIAAAVLAIGVTTTHGKLPPTLAARAVVVSMCVVVAAALPTLWFVGLAYLAHTPIVGDTLEWCHKIVGVHQQVPTALGFTSLVAAVFGTWRAIHTVIVRRKLRHTTTGDIEIAAHDRPFAFTLPGPGGHIVVSSALLDMLDDDEQAVVIAHETAHARYRHDRYLFAGSLAASIIPLLKPLAARLEFSLERWADEHAARQCGDRRFVARTLGKVALGQPTAPAGVLTFAGLGITKRVAALFAPPVRQPRPTFVIGMWAAIAGTAGLAGLQLHHLVGLVAALCPT